MFKLKLGFQTIESEGEQALEGQLTIDEFSEPFKSSISYWNRDEYLSQWKSGFQAILQGEKKSAFITSMYDPTKANFIFWWVMYRNEKDVFIQNHVLFLDELDEAFDENDFIKFVPERETLSEDGEPISEWKASIIDIREYFST